MIYTDPNGFEYARFGDSFLRRTTGSDEDWKGCEAELVPEGFFQQEERTAIRRRSAALGGSDPFADQEMVPEGATIISREGVGAVRLANPAVDAMAAELGLGPDELRERLNGAPGGTRTRVEEARFDEIAGALGLHPVDARDRFADRDTEQPSDFDELN